MVFFVLWFVDGAVAGVGAEPVAEVVGGAKVGGEDGVFFLCLRDEVAVVVALARLPVGEARPGEDAPAVGQVQVGAGVEAGAAVFFAACALVRVVGAGDVAVVGEDVGDRAHGALVERVVVVVVVVVAGTDFGWCPKMYADKRRANKKQRRHGIFEVWKLKIPFAVPVAVGRI